MELHLVRLGNLLLLRLLLLLLLLLGVAQDALILQGVLVEGLGAHTSSIRGGGRGAVIASAAVRWRLLFKLSL